MTSRTAKTIRQALLFLPIAVLAVPFIGFQEKSKNISPRWPDKQTLRRALFERRQLIFIYPDDVETGRIYTAFAGQLRPRRRRYIDLRALPVSQAAAAPSGAPVCLVGTPASNPLLARLLPKLPVSFAGRGFSINGATYDKREDVLSFSTPHPEHPSQLLMIITGNADAHVAGFLRRQNRLFGGQGDYTVYRGDGIAAYGFFEQPAPQAVWRIDPAREVNFITERQRVLEDASFVVDYIGREAPRQAIQAFIAQQKALLRKQLHQLDIPAARARAFLPIHLVLYATAERKTIATRDSRFSSWQPGEREVHIVFSDPVRGEDFTAIAEYVCWRWAGAIPNPLMRRAAGLLFSQEWGGEGYPVWAGRLFHAGFFLPFNRLFSTDPNSGVSEYITGPQLATFLQFILFHDGVRSLQTLLQNTPAQLEAAEVSRRFPPAILASWKKWCRFMLQKAKPASIESPAGFQKGFCYAHEGYAVYNGYMGSTSDKALHRLAALGSNAISITPFGHPQAIDKASPFRRSTGPGSENDESVIVAAKFARRCGMQIMLKPHIWVHGGWPGEIKMATESEWSAFFRHYEAWIVHYAILAQMYKLESLVIGVELVQATRGHDSAWRKMIDRVRQVYGGKLTYAANWGAEFENITFWDALDAIGLNCYYPLSDNPAASDAELLAGARKIAAKVERIAKAFDRPVVITEIGFASRPASWTQPHEDGRGRQPDPEAQRRAYEIIFRAFYHQPWLAGIYWWKWPTTLEDGGRNHTGFTPNGKPAEAVVARWYGRQKKSGN